MEQVTFTKITDVLSGQKTEYAVIDRGNGEFTSMLKETYDAQQATLVTESAPTV